MKMNWYVICTRPKWELKTYETLLDRNIEAYCPTYIAVRQWSDRKKKVRVPFFNGYIFVRLKEAERNRVFDIHGVIRFLFWQGKAAQVRNEELDLMKDYLNNGQSIAPKAEHLTVGEQVTFTRGALKDRDAIIEEISNKQVLLVLPALGYKITARMADLMI